MGFISTVNGKEGNVRIPALGVVIARMANFTLKRRGDGGSKESSYDLRAVLSSANSVLFNHPEYTSKREIRIAVGRRWYVLEEHGGAVNLSVNPGNIVLTIEGVTLNEAP